jgi:SpoVK/Ycf46/Vps4 family AAA+-type ATPase
MATADQLKALLRSYTEGDESRFFTVAMQIAADAARKGQGRLAEEIRALVDDAKAKPIRGTFASPARAVPIAAPRGELAGLLAASYPIERLSDMVLDEKAREQLGRTLREVREQHKLRAHGISPRRKLLLIGPPGSGKTMTASALAGELGLPLLAVRLDGLITKYMGETAAKLRVIFDAMERTPGVYLFDEFDAIGSERTSPNEVGEIRRVLNSFLQFLERDQSSGLIVAATNHVGALDRALFRRFDAVIEYGNPAPEFAEQLLRNRLAAFNTSQVSWNEAIEATCGLSYADIARASEEAAKEAILADTMTIEPRALMLALTERQAVARRV